MSTAPTTWTPLPGEQVKRRAGDRIGSVVVLAVDHRGDHVVVVATPLDGESRASFRVWPLDFIQTECAPVHPRRGCQVCHKPVINNRPAHLRCMLLGAL